MEKKIGLLVIDIIAMSGHTPPHDHAQTRARNVNEKCRTENNEKGARVTRHPPARRRYRHHTIHNIIDPLPLTYSHTSSISAEYHRHTRQRGGEEYKTGAIEDNTNAPQSPSFELRYSLLLHARTCFCSLVRYNIPLISTHTHTQTASSCFVPRVPILVCLPADFCFAFRAEDREGHQRCAPRQGPRVGGEGGRKRVRARV